MTTSSKHDLRWITWRRDGELALAVGNRGVILVFDGKNFRSLASPTRENLRAASYNPKQDHALIVGNRGTLLLLEAGTVSSLRLETEANVRRVSWSPDGCLALLVGNDGTALLWDGSHLEEIRGAFNNLRSIAWHPQGEYALISGNYFGPSMVPSPTLYRYERKASELAPLKVTDKTDLIGVDWRPQGDYALAVGYELVWQESRIYRWIGDALEGTPLQEPGLYPTTVGWHPEGEYALIGTGSPLAAGQGGGTVLRYEEGSVTRLYSSERYRLSCVAWRPGGKYALIVGAEDARTFST